MAIVGIMKQHKKKPPNFRQAGGLTGKFSSTEQHPFYDKN